MSTDIHDPRYLAALVVFERAAAKLSFSDAASELYVTPSAVSHRIALLESALRARVDTCE
ncbi:MAG: LysR family transcriptional regulator [Ilumatobacteraceae bacterium]